MWECMTSETRKGRHLLSHCSRQASQAAAKEAERLSDVERSALIFQLHGVGVRRDKTSLLEKMRASARQKRAVPAGEDTSASSSPGEKLSELYQRASQDIASLASRLAQHNGLRQFSATFSNRAPPLELRMLLPELEASIEQQLHSLQSTSNEIAQLEFPDQSRMEELKSAVCSYLRSGLEDASVTFEEQRSHLRVLQAAAPLTSPMTMPVPAMKLSSCSSPQPSQTGHFESFSTASTQSSPSMPEVQLDGWPEEDGEVDQRPASMPFAAVGPLRWMSRRSKAFSELSCIVICRLLFGQAASGYPSSAKDKPLYGPEGSAEGKVDPNTHKAHTEHKLNQDLNAGMNRGAAENNGIERPPWYTKEWPKDCQYNSPGCTLDDMETSAHKSDIHKDMVRASARWHDALAPGIQSMRFSFLQATDEDLAEVIEKLKGNEDVTELDLSHNHIKDAGIQALVAALSSGAAPKLRELKVYSNEFGKLGETMLTQGLPIFRKNLQVQWKEPSWAKIVREEVSQAKAGTAAAPPAA
ncbi:unnamed protein product [Symbiodinium sp. CCMP2456]|nr:unnamed protein product [Symbiodinium sp. CCMP2456]